MTTYDNRTRADRARLDAAVVAKLGVTGQTRGAIASAVFSLPAINGPIAARMVSASLLRLVRDGKAAKSGPKNAPTYTATKVYDPTEERPSFAARSATKRLLEAASKQRKPGTSKARGKGAK
jgi:hypothetical protein